MGWDWGVGGKGIKSTPDLCRVLRESVCKGVRKGLCKGLCKGFCKDMRKGLRKGLHNGLRIKGLHKGFRRGFSSKNIHGARLCTMFGFRSSSTSTKHFQQACGNSGFRRNLVSSRVGKLS